VRGAYVAVSLAVTPDATEKAERQSHWCHRRWSRANARAKRQPVSSICGSPAWMH